MKDMRPTMGRVVLAVFNILGPLSGRSFLDLFSGSGRIASEAIKAGASPVYAVESDGRRARAISARLPKEAKVLRMDVRRALARFAARGESFDVIYADPPYGLGWETEFPALIERHGSVIAKGGVLIYEHSDREKTAPLGENMEEDWETEERKYGAAVLTIYRRRSA
jgi:16S rRNA (guanine966-N2)-methyltransferase